MLNAIGLAHYDFARGLPPDCSLGDRIFLISEWMFLACFVVSLASEFRVRQSGLFQESNIGVGPLIVGIVGSVILTVASILFFRLLYSGEAFHSLEGWLFGVGWLFVWWCLVFRR